MRGETLRREIRVLLVDENREALAWLNKQFTYADVIVVGEAGFGPGAYTWANQLHPDVVLVAVEEPVARALKTVELLARGQPRRLVVVVSSLSENESLRRAMVAGADDFIVRTSSPDELHAALVSLVRREREREALSAGNGKPAFLGTIVCVFGLKGGIGKTTLATNLAASLAMESKQHVALVDLDLQYGDVALLMDIPQEKTISDVIDALDKLDVDLAAGLLPKHASGVGVLPAPLYADGSERISGEQIQRVLTGLASAYDYVILDTPGTLSETVLAALDMATMILLVTTPEIPSIKRTKACLDLMKQWQYPEDKVKLVINKTNGHSGANPEDIVGALRYPAFWKLPYDPVADAVAGSGGLFVYAKAKGEITKSVLDLTRKLLGVHGEPNNDGRGLMGKVTQKLFLSRR